MAKAFDPFERPELLSKTARACEIDILDRIYDGRQYEGRPNWWTGKRGPQDSTEAPIQERKPCVIYKLPKAAVQQVVRFLFGDKRFPSIALESTEETDSVYPRLSEEEVDTVNTWIADLIEHANLQPNMRAIANRAIACRTAVVVLEVDRGEFRVTLPKPQHCWAKFEQDDPTKEVERLLWVYEFDKQIADESGRPTTKRHLFRREWDKQAVYIYEDAELKLDGTVEWPTPRVEPHGLSFCPVLWIRNEAEYAQGIDGNSLYQDMGEEFEALDMVLSRRHQGIVHLGSPQLVETSEQLDKGPDATGKTVDPVAAYATKHGTVNHSAGRTARRTGPEYVWVYEGKNVSVSLLETSGKAFEVGTLHVNDIRSRILETMGVVLTSMADTISRVTVGGEMSARFLALAHAPLLALVQEYRHTWWPHGLRRVLSMLMRMTAELAGSGQTLTIPNTAKAAPILARFQGPDGWITPRMKPSWGRFFEPSSSELKTSVDAAVAARDGRVIANRTAVEHAAHEFGVDDVEVEIEEIEEDAATAQQQAQEQLENEQRALHNIAASINGEKPGADRAGGREKPPGNAGGGGGGAGPAPKKARRRGRRGGKSRGASATP